MAKRFSANRILCVNQSTIHANFDDPVSSGFLAIISNSSELNREIVFDGNSNTNWINRVPLVHQKCELLPSDDQRNKKWNWNVDVDLCASKEFSFIILIIFREYWHYWVIIVWTCYENFRLHYQCSQNLKNRDWTSTVALIHCLKQFDRVWSNLLPLIMRIHWKSLRKAKIDFVRKCKAIWKCRHYSDTKINSIMQMSAFLIISYLSDAMKLNVCHVIWLMWLRLMFVIARLNVTQQLSSEITCDFTRYDMPWQKVKVHCSLLLCASLSYKFRLNSSSTSDYSNG